MSDSRWSAPTPTRTFSAGRSWPASWRSGPRALLAAALSEAGESDLLAGALETPCPARFRGDHTVQGTRCVPQLWAHPGLSFEKLHGLIDERSGEQLYSLRLTQGARALACLREGPVLVLVSLHTQHDEAYRRRR